MPTLVLEPQLPPYSQDLLQQLLWAIESGQQQFEVIFARCDSPQLRDRLIQQLHRLSSVPLQEVILPPQGERPYSQICQHLSSEPPRALMILGLDGLQEPLRSLESLNQMRELFRQRFPCPVLFWLDGTLQKHLIRHAQDFESWGISLDFNPQN
ncbi:hypothetical protein [Sodalinema gerasimenkoae]|uniref:hypothetical protein n=1 Tax=Sodalinema gerasimenkoae TaxID=2862348 RepID=UPI001357CE7E|nr:hypothetical protein [Sodalinema gerasimenkoae]